jgi:hypothetical protein
VVLPAVVLGAWAAITLSYTYSRGDRVGYNQKFSRKGWVCKTWEGELAISNVPGQAPQLFQYTVRNASVAAQIRQLEGQRIAVTYEQHVGVPTSCFGETDYYVVSARPAGEAPFPAPFPGGAPGGQVPAGQVPAGRTPAAGAPPAAAAPVPAPAAPAGTTPAPR